MKKQKNGSAVFLFAATAAAMAGLFWGFPHARAQSEKEPSPASQSPVIDCFQYYKFGSIKLNLSPEKYTYLSGDLVKFKGTVTNENDHPVVNGEIYVKIYRRDQQGAQAKNGEFQISQFVGLKNILLSAKQQKELEFEYKLPAGLAKGEYLAQFFFEAAGKYYLSGLPFQVAVPGGTTNFRIDGTASKAIYFDKDKAEVNDKKYNFRALNEPAKRDRAIEISVPLWNPTDTETVVSLKKDLFYWDDLNAKNLISSSTETITIPAGQKQQAVYTISKPEYSVYLLQLTATSQEGQTTINVRPTINGISQPRLGYSSLVSFPLAQGGRNVMFTCFHNAGDSKSNGKVVMTLKNEGGETISQSVYEGDIPSEMTAVAKEFTPGANYGKVRLTTDLYDSAGKLVDSSAEDYDCGKFNPSICNSKPKIPASPIKTELPKELQVLVADPAYSPVTGFRKAAPILITIFLILIAVVTFFTVKARKNKNKLKNTLNNPKKG